jgi:hypothetical protein
MVIPFLLSFLLSKGEHSAYLRFNAPCCKMHRPEYFCAAPCVSDKASL